MKQFNSEQEEPYQNRNFICTACNTQYKTQRELNEAFHLPYSRSVAWTFDSSSSSFSAPV